MNIYIVLFLGFIKNSQFFPNWKLKTNPSNHPQLDSNKSGVLFPQLLFLDLLKECEMANGFDQECVLGI